MGGSNGRNEQGERVITLKTAIPLGFLLLLLPFAIKIAVEYGIRTTVLNRLISDYEELEKELRQTDELHDIRIRKLETWKESHDIVYGLPRTTLPHPTNTSTILGDCQSCHASRARKKSVPVQLLEE